MSAETTTTEKPSYILARAEVRRVERVSPNFVRVTFGGSDLEEFGTPGSVFDARIKLIFPPASGILPPLERDTPDWGAAFLAEPEDERGTMRTYSIRDLRVTDAGTEVDIDVIHAWGALRSLCAIRWLVLHGFDPAKPGCEVDVLKARL